MLMAGLTTPGGLFSGVAMVVVLVVGSLSAGWRHAAAEIQQRYRQEQRHNAVSGAQF
jgi:hypothetical protein